MNHPMVRTVALVCLWYLVTDDAAGVEHLQTWVELHRLDDVATGHAHPQR